MDDKAFLVAKAREKARKAVALVQASLGEFQPFDSGKNYTPKELEPYGALSDRFVRAVECGLKFFRSYEMLQFAEYSETTRDLLNRMHKLGLISSVQRWLEMRDVRNRVVHDYLPEQLAQLYADISGSFGDELGRFCNAMEKINLDDVDP